MLFFSDVFDCFMILAVFRAVLAVFPNKNLAPSPALKSGPSATINYHAVVVIYKRQNCTEGLLDTAGSYQNHICLSASL